MNRVRWIVILGSAASVTLGLSACGSSEEDDVHDTVRAVYEVGNQVLSGHAEPDALDEVLTGEALQVEQVYVEGIRQDGWTLQSPSEIRWMEAEVDGDKATADACIDTTTLAYEDTDGDPVDFETDLDLLLITFSLDRDDAARHGWFVNDMELHDDPCDPDAG